MVQLLDNGEAKRRILAAEVESQGSNGRSIFACFFWKVKNNEEKAIKGIRNPKYSTESDQLKRKGKTLSKVRFEREGKIHAFLLISWSAFPVVE